MKVGFKQLLENLAFQVWPYSDVAVNCRAGKQ